MISIDSRSFGANFDHATGVVLNLCIDLIIQMLERGAGRSRQQCFTGFIDEFQFKTTINNNKIFQGAGEKK